MNPEDIQKEEYKTFLANKLNELYNSIGVNIPSFLFKSY